MPARAIWKAVIRFGDVEVPVKLYSGIQDTGPHFRLLHDRDRAPLKQKMVEPEDSRFIDVVHFVPTAALDHAFYGRPYWLGPDGPHDGTYWALVDALSSEDREGIARWVMRKRAYTGALRVREDHLVLITTRHVGEVVEPAEIKPPGGRAPDPKELRMAQQLVGMLEGRFEPEQYHDEYRERVLELVRRKGRGEKIVTPKVVAKPAVGPNLAAALQKSIAAASGKGTRAHAKRRAHG